MKTRPLFLATLLTAATPISLSAATVYWDGNGDDPGAGATPTGNWGTSAFWNSDANGDLVPVLWIPSDTAVFSAGTDAVNPFVVTVTPGVTVAGIVVEEGTVSIAGGAVTLGAGTVSVAPGTTLSTDSSLRISATAGSVVTVDGGTLRTTNTGAAGTFFDADSEIILAAGGATFSHVTANILNIVQTATRITGPGSLTKTGAGVLAVASTLGNNTYAGGTIVNDGELRIRTVPNTLPVTTALTVNSPGIFNLNNVSQQVGSLTGAGLVGLGNGTLTVGDATSTVYDGSIRDTANAGAGGSGSLGGKVTKVGAGTLTLTGLNIQTGITTLSAGTITVNATASLSGPTAPLAVNAGTLNLNNAAQTVSTLSGTGGTINLGAGHVLTTDPIASGTYAGTIAGAGALTKLNVLSAATNRTLTLSGPNTYDGNTIVNGGTLAVGSATALGSTIGDTEVASGGEVLFTGGAVNFTTAEPLRIAGPGNANNGAIAVIASATPTLSGPVTLTGDATVTVSGASAGTFSNANSFTSLANQNLTLQGGSGVGAGGTISGIIALGSGGLTKLQTGKWTLGGANTYSGPTVVGAGTLNVGGSVSSSTLIDVQTGATLQVSGVAANRLGDAAGVAMTGTAKILLSASITETAGVLTLNAGAGTFDFGTGACIFTFANSSAATWTGALAITNWSGTPGTGGGTDQLHFGPGGLTAAQLAMVSFVDPAGLPAGTYAALMLPSGEVVPPGAVSPPFVLWQVAEFGADAGNPAIAGPDADPDKDGNQNLTEYALLGNPNSSTPAELFTRGESGGKMTIAFQRDITRNDITIRVQSSSTLTGAWTDEAVSVNGAAFTVIAPASVAETGGGNIKSVTFTDASAIGASPRRFLRISTLK